MYEPIYVGEVSPGAEVWYQIDHYDRLCNGIMPWLVFVSDGLSTALDCYNYARKLASASPTSHGHYCNLYEVHPDGSYLCLCTTSPDGHMLTVEPYGTRFRVALHQLRMAGVYHG